MLKKELGHSASQRAMRKENRITRKSSKKKKKKPKANRRKLLFNIKKHLTLISQSRSILYNSANIPSAKPQN